MADCVMDCGREAKTLLFLTDIQKHCVLCAECVRDYIKHPKRTIRKMREKGIITREDDMKCQEEMRK